MNDHEMSLVRQLLDAEKKLAKLEARLETLARAVVRAEIASAKIERFMTHRDPKLGGEVSCEDIRDIFSWAPSAMAMRIIEEIRKEREEAAHDSE